MTDLGCTYTILLLFLYVFVVKCQHLGVNGCHMFFLERLPSVVVVVVAQTHFA